LNDLREEIGWLLKNVNKMTKKQSKANMFFAKNDKNALQQNTTQVCKSRLYLGSIVFCNDIFQVQFTFIIEVKVLALSFSFCFHHL
jgi:hypothetical protein